MAVESLVFQEIPDGRLQANNARNFTPMDLWVSLCSLLVMVASFVWLYRLTDSSALPGCVMLIQIFVFFVFMFRPRDGLGRMYWIICHGILMSIKHAIFRHVWWIKNDNSNRFVRWLRSRENRGLPYPWRFAIITAKVDGETHRVALKRELRRPYDHVFFKVRGGVFPTVSPAMQQRLNKKLATIINQTVALADLHLGVSSGRITGPADDTRVADYLKHNLNPIIAHPERFELDEETRGWVDRMSKTLGELRPTIHTFGGAESFQYIQLTIKRDRKIWRKARKRGLSDEEIYDLPVVELSITMANALRSDTLFGFESVEVLGLAELARFQRIAFDTVTIQDYYRSCAQGEIPQTDEEIKAIIEREGPDKIYASLQCMPRRSKEIGPRGEWMRIDETYFTAFRITHLPERLRPDQATTLHYRAGAGVWTRISTVGQAVSGSAETRSLIVQASALKNLEGALYSNRVIDDPRRTRRLRQRLSQTEEISKDAIAQTFNILVVVAGDTSRKVLTERRKLMASYLEAGYPTQPLDDIAHIEDAVISGCTGINRL